MSRSPELARRHEECPDAAAHTESPIRYTEWDDWADKMQETHFQIRCICDLYVIWVPKFIAHIDHWIEAGE